jgi:hypothetical protein
MRKGKNFFPKYSLITLEFQISNLNLYYNNKNIYAVVLSYVSNTIDFRKMSDYPSVTDISDAK